jgi:hypothetical protein
MSDKALRMLKHVRRQLVKRTERYVAVREAAISIGVDTWRELMRWPGRGAAAGRTPPTLPQPQPYRTQPVPTHRPGYSRSRRGIAPVLVA